MHEYAYADRILQTVLEASTATKRPSKVTVEVGDMLGLTRESLTMAYEILSKGTDAEGSRLSVRFREGSVRCPKCGFEGHLSLKRHMHVVDPAFACPKCGSSLEVKGGLEVTLKGIEWG
jgi:hydrogenase nickel incorporation protein HypA/HybF